MISTSLLRTSLLSLNTFSLSGITAKTLNLFANESRSRGEEKFGFDNVISRLSVSESLDEIWEIYSKGKKTLTTEHYAVLSRSISRAIKKRDSQIDVQKYREMEKSIQEQSGKFNAQQYADLLFLLRVVRGKGKLTTIRNDAIDEIVRNVNEHIKNQQYMFRSLTSIYYDLSVLNKITYDLKLQILDKLTQQSKKQNLRNISIFNLNQILRAISYRKNINYPETEILSTCLQLIEKNNLYTQLNLPQKVDLFKIIAELDLQNNYNNIRIPRFMDKLKAEFEKDLEELNQKSIFTIFEALQKLPFRFYSLGDELKTIIIDNFETEDGQKSSITFSFVVDVLDRISRWRRRKLTLEEQEKIISFIQKQFDTFQGQDRKKLQKLMYILSKSIFNSYNTKNLLEKFNQKIRPEFYSINQIEVSINYNLPVANLVTSINTELKDSTSKYLKIKFYNTISGLNDPSIQAISKQLEPEYLQNVEEDIFFILNIFKDSILDPRYKVAQYEKLIDRIFKIQNVGQLNRNQKNLILRTIIISSSNKTNLQLWKQYLNQNQQNFESGDIYRAILDQIESENFHQINMIYNLLELKNLEYYPMKFQQICFNDSFIKNSLKVNYFSRKLFHYIDNIIFAKPSKPREDQQQVIEKSTIGLNLFRIIKKLQDLKCENQQYRYLLKKISLSPIPIKNVSIFCYFVEILHGKDLINKENATILLENIKLKTIPYYHALLTSYINPNQEPDYQFDNLNAKNISLLLLYNPEYYEKDINAIQQKVKGDLKKYEWELLIFSLKNFRHEKYRKITLALVDKYESYVKSYKWSENIRIGYKISTLELRTKKFWSQFLAHFYEQNNLNYDEIISTLVLISYIKYYNSKFLDYIFEKINQQTNLYKLYSSKIVNSLFRLNHQLSSQEFVIIERLFEQIKDTVQLMNLLKYLIIQEQNEKVVALIHKILGQIEEVPNERVQNSVYIQYLIKKYPEFKNKLLVITSDSKKEIRWTSSLSTILTLNPELKSYFQRLSKILNLSYEQNVKIDEFNFEYKINDHYIKMLKRYDFDQNGNITGNSQIQRRTLQQLYNVKIIFVNISSFIYSDKKSSLFQKYFNISSKSSEFNALDQQFTKTKTQTEQKQIVPQETEESEK